MSPIFGGIFERTLTSEKSHRRKQLRAQAWRNLHSHAEMLRTLTELQEVQRRHLTSLEKVLKKDLRNSNRLEEPHPSPTAAEQGKSTVMEKTSSPVPLRPGPASPASPPRKISVACKYGDDAHLVHAPIDDDPLRGAADHSDENGSGGGQASPSSPSSPGQRRQSALGQMLSPIGGLVRRRSVSPTPAGERRRSVEGRKFSVLDAGKTVVGGVGHLVGGVGHGVVDLVGGVGHGVVDVGHGVVDVAGAGAKQLLKVAPSVKHKPGEDTGDIVQLELGYQTSWNSLCGSSNAGTRPPEQPRQQQQQ